MEVTSCLSFSERLKNSVSALLSTQFDCFNILTTLEFAMIFFVLWTEITLVYYKTFLIYFKKTKLLQSILLPVPRKLYKAKTETTDRSIYYIYNIYICFLNLLSRNIKFRFFVKSSYYCSWIIKLLGSPQ